MGGSKYFLGAARWSASAKRTRSGVNPPPLAASRPGSGEARATFLNSYFEGLANGFFPRMASLASSSGMRSWPSSECRAAEGSDRRPWQRFVPPLAMRRSLEALNRELAAQTQPILCQGIFPAAGVHGDRCGGECGQPPRRARTLLPRAPESNSVATLRMLLGAEVAAPSLGFHSLQCWPEPLEVLGLLVALRKEREQRAGFLLRVASGGEGW